jgi:hypothetical protein
MTLSLPNMANVSAAEQRGHQIQKGDWVRTDDGDEGRAVLVSRTSAYVEINGGGENPIVASYVVSQLTKFDSTATRVAN